MKLCALCDRPATKLISSNNASGGNPACGSFRPPPTCDAHTDEVIAQLLAIGATWVVQPLVIRQPADTTRTPESYRGRYPLGTIR